MAALLLLLTAAFGTFCWLTLAHGFGRKLKRTDRGNRQTAMTVPVVPPTCILGDASEVSCWLIMLEMAVSPIWVQMREGDSTILSKPSKSLGTSSASLAAATYGNQLSTA